ncbi:unnamed protein product [Amoebophrya sp. A25]|nr:unnamed protein product [Amoebophrya sp. A25]|eukprot:GSA25T00013312001.1
MCLPEMTATQARTMEDIPRKRASAGPTTNAGAGTTSSQKTKQDRTPSTTSQSTSSEDGGGSSLSTSPNLTSSNSNVGMKRLYTREEVAELVKEKDDVYLFIIRQKVYKIPQNWAMQSHPGGEILLRDARGADISIPFVSNHRPEVVEPLLKRWHVGYVETEQSKMEKEFLQLVDELQKDPSWFKSRPSFYLGLVARYFTLLGCSVACALYGQSYFVRVILSAVLLGIYFQQVAFIGHDLGHNGVTHSIFLDEIFGLFWGNAMSGISGGWWKTTHNVHHLVTNSVEYDPDIQHLPMLCVSDKYFNNVFSEFHMKTFEFDKFAQIALRCQHILYYPIMALARFNLYLQSIILCLTPYDVFRRWGGKSRSKELATLGFFWSWMSLLLSKFNSWDETVVFLLVSHAIAGILHVQITISHFPMPVVEGNPLKNEKLNFIQLQLQGTIDVDCPPWMDWFHGGLQFQASHHLIPRIPRHNLRRLRDEKILPFCKKHGVEYKSDGFVACNLMVIDTLRKTADRVSPFLIDAINAAG